LCFPGERLEFIHRVHSRDIFVRGVLRFAKWLAKKKAGFYNMHDVLEL
jgi:4-hydroxy-tetrahydrodipicolinate reductase